MKEKEIICRALQVATTLAAIFILALPYPASLTNWPKLVILCAYVIAYIVVRPNRVWSNSAIIISLLLGLGFGLFYWASLDAKSIEIAGKVYIKGELVKEAKDFLDKNPSVTEEEYFLGVAKNKSNVWTPESLRKNKLYLGGLYSLFVLFLGFGILGGLERFARSNSRHSRNSEASTGAPAEESEDEQTCENDRPFT